MRIYSLAALAALIIGLAAPHTSFAHEGHDHGEKATVAPTKAASRAEAATESLEIVAVARGNELEMYLHDAVTNAPLGDATIEVESPGGPQKAALGPDGIYRVGGEYLAKPGTVDLIVTVARRGDTEILPLSLRLAAPEATAAVTGTMIPHFEWKQWAFAGVAFLFGAAFSGLFLRGRSAAAVMAFAIAIGATAASAHEGEDHGEPPAVTTPSTTARDAAERQSDGSIFVPKATQRIFGVRTVATELKAYQRSAELPGRVIPDPNASGFVQSSTGGRLSPPEGGFPRLGSTVKKGDVLAYVMPPLQAIDVSDMRQRQGEIDQQISIVQRRLARYETLVRSEAVARSQLEDTRLELEGLKERRASLDKVRREPEALIAPVAGLVADGSAVAGQIAQPNAVVFHIINPSSLWVEALSFEPVDASATSSATTSQGKAVKLAYRGSGFADRNQSIPVHFKIESTDASLRPGQFVSVLLTTDEQRKGVAVPRSALVRAANGVDLVLEKVSAEKFVPRIVRVEPLDADTVLVTAGLEAGKRIVTQGAELIDHVR